MTNECPLSWCEVLRLQRHVTADKESRNAINHV